MPYLITCQQEFLASNKFNITLTKKKYSYTYKGVNYLQGVHRRLPFTFSILLPYRQRPVLSRFYEILIFFIHFYALIFNWGRLGIIVDEIVTVSVMDGDDKGQGSKKSLLYSLICFIAVLKTSWTKKGVIYCSKKTKAD